MRAAASREQDKVTYAWLFAQSKAQHGRIVALSVLCALQAAVLVGFALACRAVIDQAVAGNAKGLLASAAALAGVIVSQLVLRLAINGTQERIRARFALELRKSMFDSIFAARYGNVLRFHSGELSNRMFSDVQVVSNGVSTIIPSFVSMIAQLVFAIAVLALISPPMVALFAGAALLSFVLARTLRGRLKALHRAVQEKEGAVRVFLQEALEHQLVIRSFGAQPATSAHADALQEDHFEAQMRRRGWSIAANASFCVLLQRAVRRGAHVVRVRAFARRHELRHAYGGAAADSAHPGAGFQLVGHAAAAVSVACVGGAPDGGRGASAFGESFAHDGCGVLSAVFGRADMRSGVFL